MSQTRSVRKPNLKYDIYYPAATPEMFVDGVDQTMQGYPVSKIVFYQTTRLSNSEEDVVQRQAALRLVIPTASLMEFCKNTLAAFGSDTSIFEKSAKRHLTRIAKVVESTTFKQVDRLIDESEEVTTKLPAKKVAAKRGR
jgi:hypothetical protein